MRRLIVGDCLHALQSVPSESVHLAYLDPPFYSRAEYKGRSGSLSEGIQFTDTWTSHEAYLAYIKTRLAETYRTLHPHGSLYLHCDQSASHYLKVLLDSLFGKQHFRREVIWDLNTSSGLKTVANNFIRSHDTILYYTKSNTFHFRKQYTPHHEGRLKYFKRKDAYGRRYRYRDDGRKEFADATPGVALSDVWHDIPSFQDASQSSELVGYPTQKPIALLRPVRARRANRARLITPPFPAAPSVGHHTYSVFMPLCIPIHAIGHFCQLRKPRIHRLYRTLH